MSEDKIIIISTHQVRDVDRILDHVLIMDNSRVLLNESTVNIQKCLLFKETEDASLLANAIYSLPSVQGHSLMLRNLKDEESDINLELLFNATLSQPKLLIELFLKNDK
jgi:ABC-2 type transport system ATP-binding protein